MRKLVLLLGFICAMSALSSEEASIPNNDEELLRFDVASECSQLSIEELERVEGANGIVAIAKTAGKALAGLFAGGIANGAVREATGIDPWETGDKIGAAAIRSTRNAVEVVLTKVASGYKVYSDAEYSYENCYSRGLRVGCW